MFAGHPLDTIKVSEDSVWIVWSIISFKKKKTSKTMHAKTP